ncbi:hypothetical protein F5887DRAFT_1075225 [Amanita rubescens]|nr:hypothetical protein F5887DRAFT_1075225 [Amanita rubescens]
MAVLPQWLAPFFGNLNQMQEEIQVPGFKEMWRLNKLDMDNNTSQIAYRAKQKEVAGDSTALANNLLVAGIGPLAALQSVPAIRTMIGDRISLNGLTHHAILQLIQYYNTDFRIQLVFKGLVLVTGNNWNWTEP